MSLFLELIQTDAQLAADAVDARREYFQGADGFAGDPRGAPSAEVRFLEWLLFERDHDGGLLVEELMPAWREMAPEAFVGREEVFLETTVGLFEVGDSAGEGLHWLRDVAGLGEYAVDLRMPSELIAAGDMIVGRVFPMGDSSHTLSPGGGCFRDETLLSAVQVDLDKARAQGDRKALRMRQVDLELMFWGKEGESRELDPVRDMRAFLEAGGLGSDEIDGLVEALAEKPLPDDDTGPLLASCLGELLDTMAFETDIDLSGAQEKILACWFYLQTAPAADLMHEQGQPAGELERMDPTDALSVFDADRRAGLDAETAISRLSANLGVDLDLDDELEESDPRPATALVHGLFAEYLWDVGRTEGEAVVAQRSGLQTSLEGLEDVEVLEELSARRLLLLGCTRLVEERGLSILDRGEAALTLGLFSAWCSEHHGMTPDSEVTAAFEGLPEAMDRISRANETLQSDALGGEWKELVPCDGRLVVQAEDGEAYPLGAAEECTGLLRSGDYVRGEFGGGSFHVSWCYPPELQLAR